MAGIRCVEGVSGFRVQIQCSVRTPFQPMRRARLRQPGGARSAESAYSCLIPAPARARRNDCSVRTRQVRYGGVTAESAVGSPPMATPGGCSGTWPGRFTFRDATSLCRATSPYFSCALTEQSPLLSAMM